MNSIKETGTGVVRLAVTPEVVRSELVRVEDEFDFGVDLEVAGRADVIASVSGLGAQFLSAERRPLFDRRGRMTYFSGKSFSSGRR